jgi:DNA-binding winged helix-turn-helix (wHTH) protein
MKTLTLKETVLAMAITLAPLTVTSLHLLNSKRSPTVHVMETKDLFEFGLFRADVRHKALSRNGRTVPLPGKAFDVLHALLQRPGQTVPKDELIKEVWPDTFVEEGNLAQMIFLLRKALGESDGGPPLIVTVPKLGYRFVGELANRAVEEAPKSASSAQPGPGPAATIHGIQLPVAGRGNRDRLGISRVGARAPPRRRTRR